MLDIEMKKKLFFFLVPFLNMILRFLNKVEIYVHADDAGKSGYVAKG